MRFKLSAYLLVAVGCLFVFNSQVQAQCASCNQAAAPVFVQDTSFAAAPAQVFAAPAEAGCGCKRGGKLGCGCKHGGRGHGGGVDACTPTGPTVQGELPILPIRSACDSPFGIGNVPSLLTPPRSYIPPIGKSVGRPLLGRWTGF